MNELIVHFFGGFFRSELVGSQDQWRRLLTGCAVLVAGAGFVLPGILYRKYFELALIDDPRPFRVAMQADLLFFLTVTMILMALVALCEWQEIFPGRRDWLILGPQPVTRAKMFGAKIAAFSIFVAVFTAFTVTPPSVMLPVMMAGSNGQWQPAPGPQFVAAYWLAAAGAGWFVFLSIATLQGLLLHLTPPRWWGRVSLTAQSVLLIALLAAVPFTLGIPGLAPRLASERYMAGWLPSFWFAEALEALAGRAAIADRALAWRAWLGLAALVASTGLLYWTGYRRGAEWLLAGGADRHRPMPQWVSRLLDLVFQNTNARAIAAFTAKTMSRSRTHTMILAAYAGVAIAMMVDGFLSPPARGWLQVRLAIPLVAGFFLASGMRHVFSIPVELPGQWVFRLRENGQRSAWLDATERLMILIVAAPTAMMAWLTSLPLGAGVWAPHTVTVTIQTMVLIEFLLRDWDQVPCACGYRPGQRELSETLVYYGIGFALFASLTTTMEFWAMPSLVRFLPLWLIFAAVYALMRMLRKQDWGLAPLQFSGEDEPLVQGLGLTPE